MLIFLGYRDIPRGATSPHRSIHWAYRLLLAHGGVCTPRACAYGKETSIARGVSSVDRVKLLIYDDHSSPQEAVKIYDRMLTKENVDLVMGPYSSTIGSAVAPIIERHRMPTLFPLAAADAIWASRPKYVFGMHTCARRWISAVLAFFARQGVERVGILVNEELFKLGTPRETNKWAKRFGQKILMKEVPNPQHVGEQIDRARKLEVEGLIVWGYMDDAVTVRKAMARADWYPQIFFSQSAPALPDYQRRLGPLANFTVGTSVWESSIAQLRPGGKSFIEAFRQEYKTEPVYHAAMGFAAGQVLAKAISRAGTLDREKIRHELAALDMVTIVGRYRVDYRGMQVRRSPLIIQWQEGQKRVIWPEALSNGQLRPENGQQTLKSLPTPGPKYTFSQVRSRMRRRRKVTAGQAGSAI